MSRRVVVLPQPDGPSRVTSVARSIVNDDLVHGDHVAVALGHAAELDRRGPLGVVRGHRIARSARRLQPEVGGARRPSRRSPTSHWMSRIAASITTISTEE